LINEIDGGRKDNARRMSDISIFFDDLISKYNIKSVCIEKLFFTEFNK
jgi:Holliday junction resolvasome RuvABC endonuclease subunit